MGVMVDIDGVLADFVDGFTRLGNEMFGLPVKRNSEQTDWDWTKSGWCTSEQEGQIWNRISISSTFWGGLLPLDNVAAEDFERIDELHKEVPLVFVTSRMGETAWKQTVSWLENHGVREPLVAIATKGRPKWEICGGLGIDTVIEDAPNQLEALGNMFVTVKIAWPYNNGVAADYTVPSIGEALALVTEV
jgi:uncharacterized HAD superfamily protein